MNLWNHRLNLLLSVGFLLVIWTPLVGMLVCDRRETSLHENRRLARLSELPKNLAGVRPFMASFKRFFPDHFGFRTDMVRLQNRIMVGVFNSSPNNEVILGRDGWLFLGSERGAVDWQPGVDLLTPEELKQWGTVLDQRRLWLAERGATYILVLVPNKHTVYREYLTRSVGPRHLQSRTDQLVDYLRRNSEITVIDLRACLMEAKKREQVYYKTDSHWNAAGATAAYQEIAHAVSELVLRLDPVPKSRIVRAAEEVKSGDLSRILPSQNHVQETFGWAIPVDSRAKTVATPSEYTDLADFFSQRPEAIAVFESPEATGSRLVMFHDSFGNALRRPLAEHFKRSIFVVTPHNRHRAAFFSTIVEAEHPVIVIQEVVERILRHTPPPVLPQAAEPN